MSTVPPIREPLGYLRQDVTFDGERFRIYASDDDPAPVTIAFDRGGTDGDPIGWYWATTDGVRAEEMSVAEVMIALGPLEAELLLTETAAHIAAVRARLAAAPACAMRERELGEIKAVADELAEAHAALPDLIRAVQQAHLDAVTSLARLGAGIAHDEPVADAWEGL